MIQNRECQCRVGIRKTVDPVANRVAVCGKLYEQFAVGQHCGSIPHRCSYRDDRCKLFERCKKLSVGIKRR